MLQFEQFIKESSPSTSTVAGDTDHAAKVHKAVIKTHGGVIHSHTESGGTHTVIHSPKNSTMKVSEIRPSTDKKGVSTISTRAATEQEKKRYGGYGGRIGVTDRS